MRVEQVYNENDITVIFRENEEEAFYALKNQMKYYLAVDILIVKSGKKITQYFRNFEKEVNPKHYQHFVQKFLEEPLYREKFLLDGESNWDGVIFCKDEKGINKQCAQSVRRINHLVNPRFKDFARLKTYGLDSFSKMQKDMLQEEMDPLDIKQIENEFSDEIQILTALRWLARGLRVEHAIRKVHIDEEIKSNMKNVPKAK